MGDIYAENHQNDPPGEGRMASPCSWPTCERFGPCDLAIICRRKWERGDSHKGGEGDAE